MDSFDATILGIASTIVIFIFGILFRNHNRNMDEIVSVKKNVEEHKLFTAKTYTTKDEMVKMVGLISAPIQTSVSDLKDELKAHKVEQRTEQERIHKKLDDILAGQALRRKYDNNQ